MTKSKFNEEIWLALLIHTKKLKRLPVLNEIITEFNMSNRTACCYLFALKNNTVLYPTIAQANKMASYRHDIRDLKHQNISLSKENDKQQAHIDFLLALEILNSSLNDFKKLTISQADMSKDENTAVALFSDSHLEERIEADVVNNWNEYNPDIAKKRIEKFFTRLMFVIRNLRKGGWVIDNLVLAILGDVINGYIHEEMLESNFMSPVEAVMFAQELLIKGITYLVEDGEFKTITIPCTKGNHGRTSTRKKYATGYKNSYEWMMYTQVMKYFKDKPGFENVNFMIPKGEFASLKIYDKTWVFSHGDHFNYRGGIGGVMIPFKGWMYKMQSILPADKYAIGHYHTYVNLQEGMINGSIVGYSPYAIGKGFKPEPPQQQLQLQDSKRGFTINVPILLEEDWSFQKK